ncbi:MAG: hypothetical protein WD648_01680, partial [Planctomycetaceae bacterium]
CGELSRAGRAGWGGSCDAETRRRGDAGTCESTLSRHPQIPLPPRGGGPGWGGKRCAAHSTTITRPTTRGTSLIEVVIAMAVASAMLATGLAVIHFLLHAERGATKNVWYGMTLTRVSRVLRSDAHAAKSVEIVPSDAARGQRLQLTSVDGGTVTYEIAQGSLSRIVQSADKVLERERFRFPETAAMTVERLSNPDRVRLELVLPRNPGGAVAGKTTDDAASLSSRTLQIEAVTSRDHRFVPAGSNPQ